MKQNQKGFTLIELLAVIVILAIIALIATPIILNTIEQARKGAAEDGAYNALKSVQTGYLAKLLTDTSLGEVETYDFGSGSNKFDVELSGDKPTSGKVTVTSSGVTIDNNDPLQINGFECTGSTSKTTCERPNS